MYLILEYAPRGEMYKALQKQPDGHFDEASTATYIGQLADALNYCHSKKVKYSYENGTPILLGVNLIEFAYPTIQIYGSNILGHSSRH